MAGEFVVGAVFTLDAAPAVGALETIGRAFETIADLATSLQEKLAVIGEGAFSGLVAGIDKADAALTRQIERVDELTAAFDRMAGAAGRADVLSGGGAVGGREAGAAERAAIRGEEAATAAGLASGSRRGGPHGRLSATEAGIGGHGVMDIGLGTLVAGWAGFKSEESAMEEQKNITETLAGVNVTPDDPRFKEYYDRLHTMLYEKTKGTKYSNLQASEIMLPSLPVLGLSGAAAIDAADKTNIFQTALNAGELSAFRGLGKPGDEAKASFQFAHLTGEFEPDRMSHLVDIVNAIAFRTGTSIAKQESIMKYAAPIGLLAGMSTEETIGAVGAAENRLGDSSTAGTGFSQFVLGGMAWKGETAHGLRKHQQNAAKAAERGLKAALSLDPEAMREHEAAQTPAALNRHDQAVVDLKIRDRAGHLLPGATDSKGDWNKDAVELLVRDYAKSHSKDEVTRIMSAAFETRGERFGQPFTTQEGIDREHQQMKSFQNAPTVKKELETLQNLPIQQFEQMLSNLANTGNILATQTLDPLNSLFKRTNELLIGFNDFLNKHQKVAEGIGEGALWAAGLAAIAVGSAASKFVWRHTGAPLVRGAKWLAGQGGAPTAAQSAEGGANLLGEELLGETAAKAGSGLLGTVFGKLVPGIDIGLDLQRHLADQKYINPYSGEFDIRRVTMPDRFPTRGGAPGGLPPPPVVNITVNNAWNGITDTATLLGNMASKLTDAVHTAMQHNSDQPAGSLVSPYTQGGYGL